MYNFVVILCYCIVAYGACNVIVYGSGPFRIFERLRYWSNNVNEHFGMLFSCMMCLPTNFGLICSLVNWFFIPVAFTPFNIIFAGNPSLWWLAMLCDASFTSGAVWLIHHFEEFFEGVSTAKSEEEYINSKKDDNNDDENENNNYNFFVAGE